MFFGNTKESCVGYATKELFVLVDCGYYLNGAVLHNAGNVVGGKYTVIASI